MKCENEKCPGFGMSLRDNRWPGHIVPEQPTVEHNQMPDDVWDLMYGTL